MKRRPVQLLEPLGRMFECVAAPLATLFGPGPAPEDSDPTDELPTDGGDVIDGVKGDPIPIGDKGDPTVTDADKPLVKEPFDGGDAILGEKLQPKK